MVYLFVGRLILDYVAIVSFSLSQECAYTHRSAARVPDGEYSNIGNNETGLHESPV
jgi:hypothetical protein